MKINTSSTGPITYSASWLAPYVYEREYLDRPMWWPPVTLRLQLDTTNEVLYVDKWIDGLRFHMLRAPAVYGLEYTYAGIAQHHGTGLLVFRMDHDTSEVVVEGFPGVTVGKKDVQGYVKKYSSIVVR